MQWTARPNESELLDLRPTLARGVCSIHVPLYCLHTFYTCNKVLKSPPARGPRRWPRPTPNLNPTRHIDADAPAFTAGIHLLLARQITVGAVPSSPPQHTSQSGLGCFSITSSKGDARCKMYNMCGWSRGPRLGKLSRACRERGPNDGARAHY